MTNSPPKPPVRLLVIEDDPSIALGLEELLKSEGYAVEVCTRGDTALNTVLKRPPQLIVLDVMLPGTNGYEICRELRRRKITTPILMLTAKGQELDKVVGFQLGADDYVTKPFGVRELVARIQALLRRSTPSLPQLPNPQLLQIGDCEIDPRTFQIRRGTTTEDLTARELKLLQLFAEHPGEVLSRDRLLNEVWGHGYFGTTRTLDQVIVQLRRKLGEPPDRPRHLLTVHGVGYRLVR